jgi:electron transport complex protein RnfE
MTTPATSDIIYQGLWKNNPGLVQLLGLCPLLAVSNTFINALGLGLATVLVLTLSNLVVALVRPVLHEEARIPVFVLVIAGFVTMVELSMQAWLYDLYLVLGIFVPLIVTNCIIMGRAEAFASRQPLWAAVIDGLSMGIGFLLVLLVLGGFREIIGSGTLFADADFLLGTWAKDLTIYFNEQGRGLLLAALPPGAFIGLGLLVALKKSIDDRLAKRKKAVPVSVQVQQSAV